MENEPPPINKPPPKQGGWLKFLLIALVPMPVGLLFFTWSAVQGPNYNGPQTNFKALAVWSAILTYLCCAIGSIGMLGGFKGGERANAWIGGILLGIGLFAFEVSAVIFLGCVILVTHH